MVGFMLWNFIKLFLLFIAGHQRIVALQKESVITLRTWTLLQTFNCLEIELWTHASKFTISNKWSNIFELFKNITWCMTECFAQSLWDIQSLWRGRWETTRFCPLYQLILRVYQTHACSKYCYVMQKSVTSLRSVLVLSLIHI